MSFKSSNGEITSLPGVIPDDGRHGAVSNPFSNFGIVGMDGISTPGLCLREGFDHRINAADSFVY